MERTRLKKFSFEFTLKSNSISSGVQMWRYAVPGDWTGIAEATLAKPSITRSGVYRRLYQQIEDRAVHWILQL